MPRLAKISKYCAVRFDGETWSYRQGLRWLPDDDVRDVAASILDQDSFLELSPKWATNIVTGMGRLEGRSVGLIANQPRALGGVIDAVE